MSDNKVNGDATGQPVLSLPAGRRRGAGRPAVRLRHGGRLRRGRLLAAALPSVRRVDRLGGLQRPGRLHDRRAGRWAAQRPLGPQADAAGLRRAVRPVRRPDGPGPDPGHLRPRPAAGRHRHRRGVGDLAALHRRGRPAAGAREPGDAVPARHRLRHPDRLLRQPAHSTAGQRGVERRLRLALDVWLTDSPGPAAVRAVAADPGKPALADEDGTPRGGADDAGARRRAG